MKLDIGVCDGWTRLERHSFHAYNESKGLQDMIERYKERTGHYPERVLVDKIYRTRENLKYCKQHRIRLSEPALGRPKFSLAKRTCGMGLIVTRLKETTYHRIAVSVLLLNLRKIEKLRAEILWLIIRSLRLGFV